MQKDREIEEWKDKFTGMKESHNSLKGKLDGLERYISDLPAPEELNKNAEDISFYQWPTWIITGLDKQIFWA